MLDSQIFCSTEAVFLVALCFFSPKIASLFSARNSSSSVIYHSYLLKGRGFYLCVFNFLFNLPQPCLVFLKLYLFSLRKTRSDNRAVVTVVTFTVPQQGHSPLSISCAVCLRSVCLLLMDVFLDVCPSARDADEREKWIHALEGTILRHTLQRVRATSRPHVP